MTHKTGNFKKFSVFIKMLNTALQRLFCRSRLCVSSSQSIFYRNTNTVFVDLLTFADLEMLKTRKQGGAPSATSKTATKPNNKRYVILTYVVEFDRVR
jgi:coiled-coil domain-containing protein 61